MPHKRAGELWSFATQEADDRIPLQQSLLLWLNSDSIAHYS